jgi:hypothetical protein
MAITGPRFDFVERLRQANLEDPAPVALRDEITAGQRTAPWAITDGVVTFKGRLYLPAGAPLLLELLDMVHSDSHEGVQRTLHRLLRDIHSPPL